MDVRYEYAAGDDTWKSPFAAEVDTDANNEDPRRAQPSPHVSFEKRTLRQTFEYDWLGNNERTTDDADGFYDRSLGDIANGAPEGATAGSDTKPYQLKGAEIDTGPRRGSLEARYDDAGYMTGMTVDRAGPCLVAGVGLSSPEACNQRFVYEWDEVGRLSRARRWDSNTTAVDGAFPTDKLAADLRYNYDAGDQRVLKEAVDQNDNKSFTVYVFETLELRRAQWSDDPINGGGEGGTFDYEANEWTVVPYLLANGVRLARVAYEPDAPKILESETAETEAGYVSQHAEAGGSLHVLFELGDHLGSTSVVLDKATGELVERSTFQAYGGSESDYRPERWGAFREDYKFTGKEEDVEVGLQYFGKRYLNAQLGRWISADPLAVHAPGEADLNVYAYVSGSVLKNVDPLGLESVPSEGDVAESDVGQVFADASQQLDELGVPNEVMRKAVELEEQGKLAFGIAKVGKDGNMESDCGQAVGCFIPEKGGKPARLIMTQEEWNELRDFSQSRDLLASLGGLETAVHEATHAYLSLTSEGQQMLSESAAEVRGKSLQFAANAHAPEVDRTLSEEEAFEYSDEAISMAVERRTMVATVFQLQRRNWIGTSYGQSDFKKSMNHASQGGKQWAFGYLTPRTWKGSASGNPPPMYAQNPMSPRAQEAVLSLTDMRKLK